MSDTSSENTDNLSFRRLTRRVIKEMPISETPPSAFFKVPNAPPSKKLRTSPRKSVTKTPTNVTFEDVTPKDLLRRVLREKKTRRSSLPLFIAPRNSGSGDHSNPKSLKRLSKSLILPGEVSSSTGSDFSAHLFVSEGDATHTKLAPRRGHKKITRNDFDSHLQKLEKSVQPAPETSLAEKKRKMGRPKITVKDFEAAIRQKQDGIDLERDTTLNSPNGKNKKRGKGTRRQLTLNDFVIAIDGQRSKRYNQEQEMVDAIGTTQAESMTEENSNLKLSGKQKENVAKSHVPHDVLMSLSYKDKNDENYSQGESASSGNVLTRKRTSNFFEEIASPLNARLQSADASPANISRSSNRRRQFAHSEDIVDDILGSPVNARKRSAATSTRTRQFSNSLSVEDDIPLLRSPVNARKQSVATSPVITPSTRTRQSRNSLAVVDDIPVLRSVVNARKRSVATSPAITPSTRRRQSSNSPVVEDDILGSPVGINARSRSVAASPVTISTRIRQSSNSPAIVEDIIGSLVNARLRSVVSSPVNISARTRETGNSSAIVEDILGSSVNTRLRSVNASPMNVSSNRTRLNSNSPAIADDILASPTIANMLSTRKNSAEPTPVNNHTPRKSMSVYPVKDSFNKDQLSNIEEDDIAASPVNTRMQSMHRTVTERTPVNTGTGIGEDDISASPVNTRMQTMQRTRIESLNINSPRESITASPVNVSLNRISSSNASPANTRMQRSMQGNGTEPLDINSPRNSLAASLENVSSKRRQSSTSNTSGRLASPISTSVVQSMQTQTGIMTASKKSDGFKNSNSVPVSTISFIPNDHLTNLPSTSGYKPGQKNPHILEDWQQLVPPLSPVISGSEEEEVDLGQNVSKTQTVQSRPTRSRPKGAVKKTRKIDVGLGNQTRALFQHFSGMPVEKDALPLVEEITEKFFENVVVDLEQYAHHARRKTIELSDVVLLMKRQKFITKNHSLQFLAAKYLPMEYREEIIPCVAANGEIFP